MAKRKKFLDPSQIPFDFETSIKAYKALKDDLLNDRYTPPAYIECYEEACIEVAATIKRAIRSSGMSREQMVDAINDYFGWTSKTTKGRKITIHMFNHYLSKPVEYPIPAALIFAIQHIARSLEIAGTFAEAEGGRVITRAEIRELSIGKLDDAIL